MAEYKAKLLNGIFTKANRCLMNNGQSVESVIATKAQIYLVRSSSFTVTFKTSYQGAFLITNANWFSTSATMTFFRCVSEPSTNKYVVGGNDIYSYTQNASARKITVNDTSSYSGSPYHYILDIEGSIESIT